jgi:2-polyprenyl-3-methyl-5-hydroxy-6-metoxy-1,4-benzoquinol methylase
VDPFWYRTFFDRLTVDFWRDAATAEWTERDVNLAWRELQLAAGSRVLDCPCGHGRHCVELARRGCQVTGIDISSYCLELARQAAHAAAVDVELRQGDMLELTNLPACDAAITLGNAFGYLDHAGMSQFVRSVAAALRPGGRWLIDTGAVAESILPTLRPELEYTMGPLNVKIRNNYLADQSCLETDFDFTKNGHTETRRTWHFIFTAAEIRRMLTAAGLSVIALYGGANGEPYTMGSHFLYIVAENQA